MIVMAKYITAAYIVTLYTPGQLTVFQKCVPVHRKLYELRLELKGSYVRQKPYELEGQRSKVAMSARSRKISKVKGQR